MNAAIPSIDALARRPLIQAAIEEHGRAPVLEALRAAGDDLRRAIAQGRTVADRDAAASAVERAALRIVRREAIPSLRPVFNLTGTVLHTNLGRAPLADEALALIAETGRASNIEYELDRGGRGERDEHAALLLRKLTGAEDALVVNNNAAAVLIALGSLAAGREVVVSRGELIEIGGAFRMPDVMEAAFCRLREVGTTNRTHPADYARAIGPETAALMKVHPSNYAIAGFTSGVDEAGMAEIAHAAGLPMIADLGSGSLVDLARYGLPHEPTVQETLRAGADIVTFSGDKLLGGPQAGLIVGRRDLIARMKKNPLKRALRVDKLIMAALVATLRLYLDPDRLAARLPTLRLLTREASDIAACAARVRPALLAVLGEDIEVKVVDCLSQIGSGALPVDLLPSAALRLTIDGPKKGNAARTDALAAAFRALPVPVVGRVQEGSLLFDLRCLEDEQGFCNQLAALKVPS
jgi:L-seryl-tRNA(Ser) seleniumtransferase